MISVERGVASGLLLAVLGSSCAFAREAGGAADPIDEVVAAEMASRRIPGLALAVIRGGRVAKEGTRSPDVFEAKPSPIAEICFETDSFYKSR